MGLDAVVFRSVRSLEREFGAELFRIEDPVTGEADVKPGTKLHVPLDMRLATEHRIGNLDQVVQLREAIKTIVPHQEAFLPSRVLYSAFHGGDCILLNELPLLEREVALLKTAQDRSLHEFISAMDDLIATARREGNPIVFL